MYPLCWFHTRGMFFHYKGFKTTPTAYFYNLSKSLGFYTFLENFDRIRPLSRALR
ncbi:MULTISPECIES: hypothetical protein [unclassified Helicobacter]|uniref:hypothetical protein n=1 Tax=unclassified Helicobacter TaxID=2593540 RepID=UPI0015F178A6|nr:MULTISPECIES: hypothetical protein [unclassified Helicobacter]